MLRQCFHNTNIKRNQTKKNLEIQKEVITDKAERYFETNQIIEK